MVDIKSLVPSWCIRQGLMKWESKDGLYFHMDNTIHKEIRIKTSIWFQSYTTPLHSVAGTQSALHTEKGKDWSQAMEGLEYPLKSFQQIKAMQSNETPVWSVPFLCLNAWFHRTCCNYFLVAPNCLTKTLGHLLYLPASLNQLCISSVYS